MNKYMEPIDDLSTVDADSFVRSQIYHLLAIGFKHPTFEWFELYKSGYFIAEVLKLLASLPRLSGIAFEEAGTGDKVYMDLEGIGYRDFEAKYVEAFDAGFSEPPCPIYSGLYVNGRPRSEVLREITAFYKSFGLVWSQDGRQWDLQDHLYNELEFLHLLTLKEFQARHEHQSKLLGYRQAQKDFLERHIIGWFPKFYEKVQQIGQLPLYPDLARITFHFTHCEYEFMRALTDLG